MSTSDDVNAKSADDKENSKTVPTTDQGACSTVATKADPAMAPELMVKHPLQYRWVLWYCKHDRSSKKDWEDCLKQVASFDTVEDFWALYNHIQLASGLTWNSDYYLFKDKIKPMWEADGNKGGGRWLIKVDKARRTELVDYYWLELLMAMIGEQFEDLGQYVCGAVVNVRTKGDKVSLWTRDSNHVEGNRRIGEILKSKLHVEDTLYYEAHDDAKSKQSSNIKHSLFV